ncbi:hypothetical protein CCB80_05315 [Armatimonadetes bacterium Uphvl-Ar1]|nr:hypothetical protein CCB80_05315 [Armatimonadetes bacterium Uphvl-Ar1]
MKRILTIGVMVASMGIAVAQSFESQISDLSLLQNKEVQNELGISEATRDKMNKFAEDFNRRANGAQEEFRKKNPSAQQPSQGLIDQLAKFESDLKKNIFGLLNQKQMKRLSELTLQAAGYPAMMNDIVAKKIGLNAAQLKKLRDEFQKMGTEVQRLQQGAMKPIYDKYGNEKPENEEAAKALQAKVEGEAQAAMAKIQPQLDKMRDGWLAVVKKTVKAIQMNRFEALQGKPFKPSGQ